MYVVCVISAVPQQLEFIADDQFSVFESYVLNDLDSECMQG